MAPGEKVNNVGQALVKLNPKLFATAVQLRADHHEIPEPLRRPVTDERLLHWFQEEANRRMAGLPRILEERFANSRNPVSIKDGLEMANRFPDHSMAPIELSEFTEINNLFCETVADFRNRARQGTELLTGNPKSDVLGTAVRGLPAGGASTRAADWANRNPEAARHFGLTVDTPRCFYRVGGKILLDHTLEFSRMIARQIGKIFPNIVMTNSEIIHLFASHIRNDWNNYTGVELENTAFLNPIMLPRIYVTDNKIIPDRLYPAGHGCYPYLLAQNHVFKLLAQAGLKYLFFSNADEWLWQPDPIMTSIAQELFDKGHHMLAIGVENANNQFGGGFVRKSDLKQAIVETPRLPWSIMQGKRAPIALNTTFYCIDIAYAADKEEALANVPYSLVVKEVPSRPGSQDIKEQIFGVDSWAGDIFSEILNPAFIRWPRLNFLGIKDGSFISGQRPERFLGGRTYLGYLSESLVAYQEAMRRILEGETSIFVELRAHDYSYLPPVPYDLRAQEDEHDR